MSGRRYRCLDCPEAMGFDLCGDCMDRGVSNIVGRWVGGRMGSGRGSLL